MSMVRVALGEPRPRLLGSAKVKLLGFLGRFTKWIPGDVIALYATAVVFMQPEQPETGPALPPVVSVEAWIITLVATPLVVLALGYVAGSSKLGLRVLFSIPAFIIWSATVPHSAWNRLEMFAQNPALLFLVLGLLALILPPLADKVIGD